MFGLFLVFLLLLLLLLLFEFEFELLLFEFELLLRLLMTNVPRLSAAAFRLLEASLALIAAKFAFLLFLAA